MMKCFVDRHNHYRRWLLTVDGEASLEVRICANPRAPIDTNCLVRARHKENQRNARVLNKIFETVDLIVAAPVRYEQRLAVVDNLHEAGLIPLRRAVETQLASGGNNEK